MTDRVKEINAELRRMTQIRLRLLEERRQLALERYVPEHASEFWTDRVFKIIENHPGISRSKILSELINREFSSPITANALTNTLTTLRRRGSIENRGTKKRPQWYIN